MVAASEIHQIAPGTHRWCAFSPEHKVELTSHSVYADGRLLLFDPIPVSAEILDWFPTPTAPDAIVLTNANHLRAAPEWVERFSCPIYGPAELAGTVKNFRVLDPGLSNSPWPGWEHRQISGGAPGEMAFYLPSHRLAVFGDAFVNLPSRRLELLPDKYCSNPSQLRASLQSFLTRRDIAIGLFSHGEPILTWAIERLLEAAGWGVPLG